MNTRVATTTVCIVAVASLGLAQGRSKASQIATFSTLPSLGGPTEALAVNSAGTVIVGSSRDRSDLLYAVKWTLGSDGSWAITTLPWPLGATSAIARGINDFGDVAGNDFPSTTSRPLVWPDTGGFSVLGCADDPGPASVYDISAVAQVVVGKFGASTAAPAVWRPGSCREGLPATSGVAFVVNGDGTVVGGTAVITSSPSVPVRWIEIDGQWQIEQLDGRSGSVSGANTVGDLAGYVVVPCALADGCGRAVIWYAAGDSHELGTLGGNQSWALDINASGEVVGVSTAPRIGNTAYFWSASTGMVQLPFKGRFAVANALSDVRSDGTRLVVGMNSQADAVVWVVRTP